MTFCRLFISCLTSCFVLACAAAPVGQPGDELDRVSGGKADDFFSPSVFEYVFEGRTTVTIEEELADASESEQLARVNELIGLKHLALAYFLTQYLVDKEPREAGHGWGGFGGMAKAGSYRELDIQHVDGLTWAFTFQQLVASHASLVDDLPVEEGEDGAPVLSLVIGNPSNEELASLETDHEWFRQLPWKGWDPALVTDESKKTELVMSIRFEEASSDAWLDYPGMLEDGLLRIDVHLGYDYHSQYHRKHARSLYLWLKNELGYDSPVTAFDRLTRESGPFTTTLDANGQEVRVEVRLFYGKDGADNDPNTDGGGLMLERDFMESFRAADVVMFTGHAGPFYGFSLANWKRTDEGDISYREIEAIELSGSYQLIIADGCDTYQIGQAFERNGTNHGQIDVITTTSFGDAELPYSVMNTISHLTETDPGTGSHRPRTIRSLLVDLIDANFGNPLYGMHFIDDNPTSHPYADPDWIGEGCSYHYQCGAPGNRCVAVPGTDEGICASACTNDSGCPRGTRCRITASPSAHAIYDHGCVPLDYASAYGDGR